MIRNATAYEVKEAGDINNKSCVSKWCGTKHNVHEFIILKLTEDTSNNPSMETRTVTSLWAGWPRV